jgi:hypothetical protein
MQVFNFSCHYLDESTVEQIEFPELSQEAVDSSEMLLDPCWLRAYFFVLAIHLRPKYTVFNLV